MLFFVIGFIGIVLFIVACKWDKEDVATGVGVITGVYWFFLIVIGCFIVHSEHTEKIEEYLSFQDKLEYYYDIHSYRNQLSENEIMKSIEYNRWVEKGQINNKSLWFGWFTPNRFEELKEIDIGKLFK